MWPVVKQLSRGDLACFGENAYSERTRYLQARTKGADKAVASICLYCAVEWSTVHVREDKMILYIHPADPV